MKKFKNILLLPAIAGLLFVSTTQAQVRAMATVTLTVLPAPQLSMVQSSANSPLQAGSSALAVGKGSEITFRGNNGNIRLNISSKALQSSKTIDLIGNSEKKLSSADFQNVSRVQVLYLGS